MFKKLSGYLLALFFALHAGAKPPGKGKKPRNIILMIGDGTGLAQLFAAYAANGFFLDIFSLAEVVGLSNTASSNNFITDSAAGATALSTGSKTRNYMLGMAPDSSSLTTVLESAHKCGLGTGLVVTCALTHATPAGFYAHQPSRRLDRAIAGDFYSGYTDIAIGSGKQFFDSARLVELGYSVNTGLAAILNDPSAKQVGFYSDSLHPPKMSEGRGPFLEQASMHSIKQLSMHKKGFFLMIEGSQIDWGGHENDSDYVLRETLDFNATAKKVIEWAKRDGNTLVIITADHETGGLGLMGYDSLHMRPRMSFFNKEHSAIMVPVFAVGPGAEAFGGVYQNTEIYFRMMEQLRLKR